MKLLFAFIASLGLAGMLIGQSLPTAPARLLDHRDLDFRIDRMREPAFPVTLLTQGYTEGYVELALEVDYAGELRDWVVVEASHPEFVTAIERVIHSWDFSPPKIDGESRSVVTRLRVNFRSTGNVVNFDLLTGANARLNEIVRFQSERVQLADPRRLDAPPRVTATVTPAIPREILHEHRGAKAVFTFFVDGEGRVRVPALSQLDGEVEPGMLLATQEALSQWRFEPPRHRRQPVSVRLAQTFVYSGD